MNKKIKSAFIILSLLIGTLAIIPSANAVPAFHVFKAKIYLNDEVADAGVEVRLTFDNGVESDVTLEDGYVNIAFLGHDGMTGEITVFHSGALRAPDNLQTIDVTSDQTIYPLEDEIMSLYVYDLSTYNRVPRSPKNPTPTDGETQVSKYTKLSWECIDPDDDDLRFHIYLGKNSLPTEPIIQDYSSTIYYPDNLESDTEYHWKIIAEDSYNQTNESSEWTFTTAANSAPTTPNEPTPFNQKEDVSKNQNLKWNCTDPDDDELAYDVYFGINSNLKIENLISSKQKSNTYDPGKMDYNKTYYWKIIAFDIENENYISQTSGPVWEFSISDSNKGPYTPTIVSPENDSSNVDINQDLIWEGGDRDGDVVKYDIYLDQTNPPEIHKKNYTSTTYSPDALNFDTTYYWKIVSKDSEGKTAEGKLWQFSTIDEATSGYPNAKFDITGSKKVGVDLSFDASESTDSDGTITNYQWDFDGDGNYDFNSSDATATHKYTTAKKYNVKLKVTDNSNKTDTERKQITITGDVTTDNNAPDKPSIEGEEFGSVGVEYTFVFYGYDQDDDDIQFEVEYGDGESEITGFIPSNSETGVDYSWFLPGKYEMKVKAIDNHGAGSVTAEMIIWIDTYPIQDIGYLMDKESDGVYDEFFSEEIGEYTQVNKKDTTYLLDINGDEEFDHQYNIDNDILIEYTPEEDEEEEFPLLLMISIIVIITLVAVILYLFIFRKKQSKADETFFVEETTEKKVEVKKPAKNTKKAQPSNNDTWD